MLKNLGPLSQFTVSVDDRSGFALYHNSLEIIHIFPAVPTVYVIPKELIVSQGREVAVACHATGSPPPTIYWNYESSSVIN